MKIVPEGLNIERIYSLDELEGLGFQYKPSGMYGNLEMFKHCDEDKKNLTYLFVYEGEGYKLESIFGSEKKLKLNHENETTSRKNPHNFYEKH